MEERKIASAKDSMNVLYVALTRAVEGMIIIRKPKDSIFDALDMEVMSVGGLRQAQPTNVSPLPESVEGKVTITNYGTQETPEHEEVEEKDYEAILFGTALHYTLEMLGAVDGASVRVAMTALQNKYGQQLSQQSIVEIEKRVNALVVNTEFRVLLNGAKVRKEQSLSFEGELKQIDLLLEYEEYNLVIDYKSSKKYGLKHQSQVGYYKKAIGNITGKRTEGMVVYLLNEGIELLNLK
jgi:exodeoxyribonuclease V beta subunit